VPRIGWIEEGDARGQLADLFAAARAGVISGVPREKVPDILHTMSQRPDFLAAAMDASKVHFSEGALSRAQHEMIASYVSALNKCHY
jgi:alkylhydroperoxidase family enzyme